MGCDPLLLSDMQAKPRSLQQQFSASLQICGQSPGTSDVQAPVETFPCCLLSVCSQESRYPA